MNSMNSLSTMRGLSFAARHPGNGLGDGPGLGMEAVNIS
jgi:hypothetical protein